MQIIDLETQLKGTPAYAHPQGKKVIDEALIAMHVAEAGGNVAEQSRITEVLTQSLTAILTTLSPRGGVEATETMRNFEQQFGQRMDELDAFGIINKQNPTIQGINNQPYRAPSWDQIKAGLTLNKMRLISQLENPTLLLVPDGMSLDEYLSKAKADKQPPKRKLPWDKASDIDLNADKGGKLLSGAGQYDKTNHSGKTKMQRLQEPGSLGWQVYVVDGGDEVPAHTLNKRADDLLKEFKEQGFCGLTAEAGFALQMHGQVRGNQFDKVKWGWLLDSYLTSIGSRGVVLNSDWRESDVYLNRFNPRNSLEDLGARRAVRVL